MEFLQYAYLQTGQNDKARDIVQQAATIKAGDLEPGFEGYYGWVEASFPIRLALETSDWSSALRLQPSKDAGRYVRRVDSWSHAVAAGHLHDVRGADQAVLSSRPRLQNLSSQKRKVVFLVSSPRRGHGLCLPKETLQAQLACCAPSPITRIALEREKSSFPRERCLPTCSACPISRMLL